MKLIDITIIGFWVASTLMMTFTFLVAYTGGNQVTIYINNYGEAVPELIMLSLFWIVTLFRIKPLYEGIFLK